jgi:hypothetical protein
MLVAENRQLVDHFDRAPQARRGGGLRARAQLALEAEFHILSGELVAAGANSAFPGSKPDSRVGMRGA